MDKRNTEDVPQGLTCSACGEVNRTAGNFCAFCGARMTASAAVKKRPAFASLSDDDRQRQTHAEQQDRFAQGLPDWDILPPMVVTRGR